MRKYLLLAVFGLTGPAFGQAVTTTFGEDGPGAYKAAVKKAESGERVVLVLGANDSLLKPGEKAYRYTKYTEAPAGMVSAIKDQEPGVYEVFKAADGDIQWQRRVPPVAPPPAAPPVAPPVAGWQFGVQFTGPFGNTLGGQVCVGRS